MCSRKFSELRRFRSTLSTLGFDFWSKHTGSKARAHQRGSAQSDEFSSEILSRNIRDIRAIERRDQRDRRQSREGSDERVGKRASFNPWLNFLWGREANLDRCPRI